MPTNCYDRLEVDPVNQVGLETEFPEGSLVIVGHNGSHVDFEVTQSFTDDSMKLSVRYYDSHFETTCDYSSDVSAGAVLQYSAQCVHGYADITVFVFFGSVSDEECQKCEVPDSSDTDSAAYHFEIPCDSDCYSPAPSESIAPSSSPTDCYDRLDVPVVATAGPDIPLPEDAVVILDHDGTTVKFQVTQLWDEDVNINMISFHLHESVSTTECIPSTTVETGTVFEHTAYCFMGYADVGIYIYIGDDFDESKCEACSPPEPDDENVVVYYFEIPCDSECAPPTAAPQPEVLNCYDGVVLDDFAGTCMYHENPVEIISQEDDHVLFSLSHTWNVAQQHSMNALPENLSQVSIRFTADGDDTVSCTTSLDVEEGFVNTFKAKCNADGVAEIEVYVHDDAFSKESCAQIPEQCDQPAEEDHTCAYFFVIPCREDLMCDGARRLEKVRSNIDKIKLSSKSQEDASIMMEAFKEATDMVADNESDENELPYCVSDDFPCEGENMVFVCHYSVLNGYQTFCVPEGDSDILRFYPNDYCGPCNS